MDNLLLDKDVDDQEVTPNEALSMHNLVERLDKLLVITDRYGLVEIADKVKGRKRDSSLPVLVVIAGEGNYGKSSLLNALAGKDIAPVSIVPLTWKVDVYRLSNSNREYAQVRYISEETYQEFSIEEAQELCKQEELAIKNNPGSKPRISEVIWHRTDLKIGSEICLVDTPGLEQAGLGVDIKSERLVKGLGATYTVDEVWHYYYYKADVVLWVFDAAKLDSKGTFDTISQLVKIQAKQIVPIVTKADRVPQERWPEIAERFKKIYGQFFSQGLSPRLFCTVCGGKSPLVGTGVNELHSYIEREIVPRALPIKCKATKDFCRDTSKELHNILHQSAKQLVENLRIMADTADEVALNLMRIGAEQRNQTAKRINDYMEAKAEGVHDFLYPVVENAIQHQTMSSIKYKLNEYLALTNVERILETQLREISSQIQSLAVALCKQRHLHKITIGANGKETRNQFSFLIDIKDPQLPPIHISDITYSLPEIGIVDGVVRGIKNLLGFKFRMTDDENKAYMQYVEAVAERLDQITEESYKTFHVHIQSRIGPALTTAVTSSLNVSTRSSASEIIALLQNVDDDLRQLITYLEDWNHMPTQFANWARYWIAESRDVTLARQLVMDVLWPRLKEMQTYIRSYSKIPALGREFKKRFSKGYKKGRRTTVKSHISAEFGPNNRGRSISNIATAYLRCGARPALVEVNLNYAAILNAGTDNKLADLVVEDFKQFMRKDPILDNMEQQIGEALPDAVVNGFKSPYSHLLSLRMFEALLRLESRDTEVTVPTVKALGFLFSGSLGSLPFIPISLSPFAGVATGLVTSNLLYGLEGTACGITSSMVLMLLSNRLFKRQMYRSVYQASLATADSWVGSSSSVTAARLDEDFFKQLVERLTLQLSPRPLQRVTLGELSDVE